MTSIVYYSNHCEYSKKLLQSVSKTQLSKDIHFICIPINQYMYTYICACLNACLFVYKYI